MKYLKIPLHYTHGLKRGIPTMWEEKIMARFSSSTEIRSEMRKVFKPKIHHIIPLLLDEPITIDDDFIFGSHVWEVSARGIPKIVTIRAFGDVKKGYTYHKAPYHFGDLVNLYTQTPEQEEDNKRRMIVKEPIYVRGVQAMYSTQVLGTKAKLKKIANNEGYARESDFQRVMKDRYYQIIHFTNKKY